MWSCVISHRAVSNILSFAVALSIRLISCRFVPFRVRSCLFVSRGKLSVRVVSCRFVSFRVASAVPFRVGPCQFARFQLMQRCSSATCVSFRVIPCHFCSSALHRAISRVVSCLRSSMATGATRGMLFRVKPYRSVHSAFSGAGTVS